MVEFLKVCGIKSLTDAEYAIESGFTAIGVVFHKKSKRFVDFEKAKKIAEFCKGKIQTVAVGINYREVEPAAKFFDFVQLYEYLPLKNLIFASSRKPSVEKFKFFLYDKGMGDGKFRQFPEWLEKADYPVILAGGLSPENVGEVVKKYSPVGVDVSSGVETNGVKDFEKMKQFVKEVRNAE